MTNSDSAAAPSTEGAVARVRAAGTASRQRLAELIETTLNRIFDAPLDIRNGVEALRAIDPTNDAAVAQGAVRKAAEWGAARAVAKVGARYGSKAASRMVIPLTVAMEFGLNARDGLRELQVLASLLVGRLRAEGYPVEPELVRRTVLAVYLEPGNRPDLRIPLHRRTLHLARRWTFNTLPLTGRHQASLVRRRVDTMAGLYLSVLLEDWARVCAIETSLVPPRQMLEGRIADPGSAGSASPTH